MVFSRCHQSVPQSDIVLNYCVISNDYDNVVLLLGTWYVNCVLV